jgi:hypothetical protein
MRLILSAKDMVHDHVTNKRAAFETSHLCGQYVTMVLIPSAIDGVRDCAASETAAFETSHLSGTCVTRSSYHHA